MKNDLEKMKIPKFENEIDEANWAFEHRDELATAFMGEFRPGERKRTAALESILNEALQTKELSVTPQELNARSVVSILREKLRSD